MDHRDTDAPEASVRARWWWVVVAAAVLGVPTAIAPESTAGSITYLIGLATVVATLGLGARRWRGPARLGWHLVTGASVCWLLGDLIQRITMWTGGDPDAPGLPDVCWLASYPVLVAGIGVMIHGRELGATVRREVALDVLVVTMAGALGAWKLMVSPDLGDGALSTEVVLTVLYPLGDVALFATALTLLIAPGRPSLSGRLVVTCLGATLLVDAAITAVSAIAPGIDTAALDALLLPVNALLAAGALHPSGARLAEAPDETSRRSPMHRWRVVLLGGALVVVDVASVLPAEHPAADTPILLAAAAGTSVGVVARFYGVVRRREAAELRLAHQAHHDPLTGLANRELLFQRLDERLSPSRRRADEDTAPAALVYLDLDGFKEINDRHGHAAGDQVLTTVAERLLRATRSGDTVARLGGDEFVVLCPEVRAGEAERLGIHLRDVVCGPVDLSADVTVVVGASVGVASLERRVERSADVAEAALREADSAMYRAKHAGGGVRLA